MTWSAVGKLPNTANKPYDVENLLKNEQRSFHQ